MQLHCLHKLTVCLLVHAIAVMQFDGSVLDSWLYDQQRSSAVLLYANTSNPIRLALPGRVNLQQIASRVDLAPDVRPLALRSWRSLFSVLGIGATLVFACLAMHAGV